jgi:hypothetical protein
MIFVEGMSGIKVIATLSRATHTLTTHGTTYVIANTDVIGGLIE